MIALIPIVVFLSCIAVGSSYQKNLVLDGVSLPVDITPSLGYFPALFAESAANVDGFLANYTSNILSIIGKKKTDPATYKVFEDLHQHYVDLKIKPDLPAGYLFFGDNKNYEIVPYMFKTNAFFISLLRSGPNMTLEIDPFGKRGSTYFSQLTSLLTNKQPRVSATFDSSMNIIKMAVFNATTKRVLTGYTREQAATLLLYQCSYAAQNVHVTSHIYNVMMSAAMDYATTNTSLNSWARTYMFTLSFVYTQIENVAFAVDGVLTGSAPSSSGFDMVDRAKVLAIDKAMLKEMGKYKTSDDYVKKFLMKNIDQSSLKTNGVGRAILRQAELVAPYSAAMEVEFKKDPNYKSITSNLKAFLASTGTRVNSINSMKSWLELNTLTGILHGSAFSLLRLLNTHSIMSVNSIDSATFTVRDAKLLRGLNAVTLGTHEEFYSFSAQLPSVNPYDINKVLQLYDSRTTALKNIHQDEITQNAEEYKRFGWILSDHGPNFKDGKQLSHTGYF